MFSFFCHGPWSSEVECVAGHGFCCLLFFVCSAVLQNNLAKYPTPAPWDTFFARLSSGEVSHPKFWDILLVYYQHFFTLGWAPKGWDTGSFWRDTFTDSTVECKVS